MEIRKLLKWMPDTLYLKLLFYRRMGKRLNLKNPVTYNEKLQYLKLYDRKQIYTNMVDKYEVRKYIKNILGEQYLIPLLGVYSNFNEIDFNTLPDQFVLKCTHDSGGLVICKDKQKLDFKDVEKKIKKSLKQNYYYLGREWPYKNVKPRIICEKYMDELSREGLIDYKFMCFNGEVKCVLVCQNRNSLNGLNIDFYDINWNLMPIKRPNVSSSGELVNKPINYKKMIEYAERLSKGTPFLRVDFYEIAGKLYFGELTFYPNSGLKGFTPESYDTILGTWIDLPINR